MILASDWSDSSPITREMKRLPSGVLYTVLHGDFPLEHLLQALRLLPERIMVFSTEEDPKIIRAIHELPYTAPLAHYRR